MRTLEYASVWQGFQVKSAKVLVDADEWDKNICSHTGRNDIADCAFIHPGSQSFQVTIKFHPLQFFGKSSRFGKINKLSKNS